MQHFLPLILAAAASVHAIQVTSPTQFTVWDASSSTQTVSWSSVDTDATSFAIVLVNQDRNVLPQNDQLLAANVSTSAGSASVTYPGGAWPVGNAFQVNLIKSSTDINTIYAQSNDFNITGTPSSTTSTSSGSTASAATNTGSTLMVSNTASGSGSATGSAASPSGSSDSLPNTGGSKSGAVGMREVKVGGLVLALGFLGALLA